MPRTRPPAPPDFDWRAFVDEMRTKRLDREFNRPSDLLRHHSLARWKDGQCLRGVWFGGLWPRDWNNPDF